MPVPPVTFVFIDPVPLPPLQDPLCAVRDKLKAQVGLVQLKVCVIVSAGLHRPFRIRLTVWLPVDVNIWVGLAEVEVLDAPLAGSLKFHRRLLEHEPADATNDTVFESIQLKVKLPELSGASPIAMLSKAMPS